MRVRMWWGRGVEVETRPSRLGLARVVVVRGASGPLQHVPIIDDYIRMTEPVYDYLTPFSGAHSFNKSWTIPIPTCFCKKQHTCHCEGQEGI